MDGTPVGELEAEEPAMSAQAAAIAGEPGFERVGVELRQPQFFAVVGEMLRQAEVTGVGVIGAQIDRHHAHRIKPVAQLPTA